MIRRRLPVAHAFDGQECSVGGGRDQANHIADYRDDKVMGIGRAGLCRVVVGIRWARANHDRDQLHFGRVGCQIANPAQINAVISNFNIIRT